MYQSGATLTIQKEEFHEFEVDKAIVGDLIHSQNGTISTAIRELVMNAIDAGSPTCAITLGSKSFGVADTGSGFGCRENIEKFFKRFGEPHKAGDATFGRFRIGRGQIMAFGNITWHSNEFKMKTDVVHCGNGFQLIEDVSDVYHGCHVYGDFYDPIREWDLRNAKEELSKLVKYADQDITYNGVFISHHHDIEWDYEDEELKIKWDPAREDGIYLYSLGIFVKEINMHHYGVNADVVTKKALTLNMARNEISDTDPLWQKINEHLKARSLYIAKTSGNSKRMDETTRRSVIRQLMSGDIELNDVSSMGLLRDCRGHTFALNALWTRKQPFTIAPQPSSRTADAIATRQVATVLHYDELRLWGVDSLQALIDELSMQAVFCQRHYIVRGLESARVLPFDLLASGISEDLIVLKPSQLKARESAARNALQYVTGVMSKRLTAHSEYDVAKRKIIVGDCLIADGWTDGTSYIAVSKQMLSLLDRGYYGAVQLAMLLLHEYCHDSQDLGSHEHNFTFYERYHDLSTTYKNEVVGHTATSMYNRYLSELQKRREALPKESVKTFKWPVVNELRQYTGQMNEKTLSPLARLFLDASGANYKITKSTFTAYISLESEHACFHKIDKQLSKQVIVDGFQLPDSQAIRALHSWHESQSIESKQKRTVLEAWALKHNHDYCALSMLLNQNCSFNDVLRAVCIDKQSGLYSYEYEELYPTRVVGSAQYYHRFKTDSVSAWHRKDWVNSEMAKNRSLRFEYAVAGIKDIVNGIKDQDERQIFIDTFLGENLAIQC